MVGSLTPIFLILVMVIIPAYADSNDTINLTQFPDLVSESFNVDAAVAGLILSTCVMLSLGLALAYLKAKGLILLTVELIAMGGCIMLGWLPIFLSLVVVLLIALFYADKIRRSL